MKSKLVIFDLDDTLYRGNSTFDFIHYVCQNDERYMVFKKYYKIMRIYNKFTNCIFGYDWYKIKSVQFLQGFKKNDLIEKSKAFYKEILKYNKMKNLFLILEMYKKEGYEICILSATLDIVALEIGRNLNIDKIYSTKLLYDENICTGKYEVDLLNNKLQLYREKILGNYDEVLFFSDNQQDIELLKEVTTGFRVYPNE